MARISFSGEYDGIRYLNSDSKLVGFVSFVDEDTGLRYQDWRLVDGRNGLFVSSPRAEYENRDGETVRYNLVDAAWNEYEEQFDPRGQEWLQDVEDAVLDLYYEEEETREDRGSSRGGGRSSGRRGRSSGSSGRSSGRKGRGGRKKKGRKSRGGRKKKGRSSKSRGRSSRRSARGPSRSRQRDEPRHDEDEFRDDLLDEGIDGFEEDEDLPFD